VHGWIYGVHDGVLHDLRISLNEPANVLEAYKTAVSAIFQEK
jgi:carbonic anhydrase